jgi:hypothetical protein
MRSLCTILALTLSLSNHVRAQTGSVTLGEKVVPQGTSPSDVASRIAIFARFNGDSAALENLEGDLPKMAELSVTQREGIQRLIREAREENAQARARMEKLKTAKPSMVIERDAAIVSAHTTPGRPPFTFSAGPSNLSMNGAR